MEDGVMSKGKGVGREIKRKLQSVSEALVPH